MTELIDLSRFDNSDFDRGASRFKEILWVFFRGLFFLPSFPIPTAVRVWLLRCFGARIGKSVVIRSRVNITFPWRLEIGDFVWIGEEVLILCLADVKIGANVCISQRAFLCTGSHNFSKSTFDLLTQPITIHDHSWIAATAFVGPGSNVPQGTLVKAGEVITAKTFHNSEPD